MNRRFTIGLLILALLMLLLAGYGCSPSEEGGSDSIIWGRVRSIGNALPIPNLRFTVDNVNIFGATDETGYFRLDAVPIGEYEGRLYRHGHLVSMFEFAVTGSPGQPSQTIQIGIPDPLTGSGSLNGIVKNKEGEPLPGAEVLLGRPDENMQITYTDENGAYAFGNLPELGSYTVIASIDGYKPDSAGLVLNPESPDRITFELEAKTEPVSPFGFVRGNVTDELGASIPGAYITIYPLNAVVPVLDKTGETLTNLDGDFDLGEIIEGPYILWVGKSGFGVKVREIYVTANLAWEGDIVLDGSYSKDP